MSTHHLKLLKLHLFAKKLLNCTTSIASNDTCNNRIPEENNGDVMDVTTLMRERVDVCDTR